MNSLYFYLQKDLRQQAHVLQEEREHIQKSLSSIREQTTSNLVLQNSLQMTLNDTTEKQKDLTIELDIIDKEINEQTVQLETMEANFSTQVY